MDSIEGLRRRHSRVVIKKTKVRVCETLSPSVFRITPVQICWSVSVYINPSSRGLVSNLKESPRVCYD